MTEVVPVIARKVAEKVYKGEYPAVLEAVRRILDHTAVQLATTMQSAGKRLNDHGIYNEIEVKKTILSDGFEVCARVRVVGIDPIKFDIVRMVTSSSTGATPYTAIANSNMIIEMIKEEVMRYLEDEIKMHEKMAEAVQSSQNRDAKS